MNRNVNILYDCSDEYEFFIYKWMQYVLDGMDENNSFY